MLLLRGATTTPKGKRRKNHVSIHAPLARSNSTFWRLSGSTNLFQYMLLLRGATRTLRIIRQITQRFNTCSSCEEQLKRHLARRWHSSFNTCSSCEEQRGPVRFADDPACFNTCSSCEEQLPRLLARLAGRSFNTCSSCEEQPDATECSPFASYVSIHAPLARSNLASGRPERVFTSFNTCSSCEEQPFGEERVEVEFCVSIHAPLARSNRIRPNKYYLQQFQYMLLLRGATCRLAQYGTERGVSIHAPLARSNKVQVSTIFSINGFQYMLLLRGATCPSSRLFTRFCVSIHAPLARSNENRPASAAVWMFQYMLLLRGATRA